MENFRNHFSIRGILGLYLVALILLLVPANCSYDRRINIRNNEIYITNENVIGFEQTIDTSMFDPEKLSSISRTSTSYILEWKNQAKLKAAKKDEHCDTYELISSRNAPLRVIFNTTQIHLFGGPERTNQPWPANTLDYKRTAYVSTTENDQAILEAYWLASNGIYLYVDDETPLFIEQNLSKQQFSIIASKQTPYSKGDARTILKYTVCALANMRAAHQHAVSNVLGKPKSVPNESTVRFPTWSVWTKDGQSTNQQIVQKFAEKLNEMKLAAHSQIEIADNWEACPGTFTANALKYPDMRELVAKLKSMSFRVTVRVHPFIDVDCDSSLRQEGRRELYFVMNEAKTDTTTWKNGQRMAYIDFTKASAADWFRKRLGEFARSTGIDSFRFDAGKSSWCPQTPVFYHMRNDHPETNLKKYVETASTFGNAVIVNVARRTQEYPIFVRMNDHERDWERKSQLQILIPRLLQMNVLGYPFVFSDIGSGVELNDETFVRWLQISTFMPTLHFSYSPFKLSGATRDIAKTYIDLHNKHSNTILCAMQTATKTGNPVNPPIWWIDPENPETYPINDEFLLGEDILVAPIIKPGTYYRNIYLPKGVWKDEMTPENPNIKGPTWLLNYKVPLEKLAYFARVSSGDNHEENDQQENAKNGSYLILPTIRNTMFSMFLIIICKLFRDL